MAIAVEAALGMAKTPLTYRLPTALAGMSVPATPMRVVRLTTWPAAIAELVPLG